MDGKTELVKIVITHVEKEPFILPVTIEWGLESLLNQMAMTNKKDREKEVRNILENLAKRVIEDAVKGITENPKE